jgi:hypothetical protein
MKSAVRAYDAVHLATAIVLREEAAETGGEAEQYRVMLKTYDETLLTAAREEGLS